MKITMNKYALILISALIFTGCLGDPCFKTTRSFSGRNTFYKNSGFDRVEILKTAVDKQGNLNIRIQAETRKDEYEGDYYTVSTTLKESPHAPKAFFLTILFPVNMILAPIASNSSYEQEFSDLRTAFFGNTLSTSTETAVENVSQTGNSSFAPMVACEVNVTANSGPAHQVRMTDNTGSINLNTLVEDYKSVPDSLKLVVRAGSDQTSVEKKIIIRKKQLARLNLPVFTELTDFEKARKTDTIKSWATYLKKYPESGKKDEVLSAIADIFKKDNSVTSAITFLESFPEGEKHFPVIAELLDTGPEKLTVKEVLKFKQQGIGEMFIISKISRATHGYRDFSFDEIKVLKEMGLSDSLIQSMIDVTFRLEQAALKNQQIEMLKAENERLRRETAQAGQNTAAQTPSVSQENTFTDVVAEELKKEAAKKVAEKLLDLL